MQNNPMNNFQCYPQQGPNAVSINIYSPQAYGNGATNPVCTPCTNNNFYSMYGENKKPELPLYPQNYNNLIPQQQQNSSIIPSNKTNEYNDSSIKSNTSTEDTTKNTKTEETTEKKDDKKKEEKTITPLTDEYVKSLENYLNDANPKVRLIAAKELLERFKEDDNRKDNPSLIPLVNKILQDSSPAVRFLGLTMLNLDYCTGDNLTVDLLKQIQAQNTDKVGEDQLLASEILLRMSAPDKIKVQQETAK